MQRHQSNASPHDQCGWATNQREILTLLAEVWALASDVRLGQLMAHLGFLGEDRTGWTLWDIDDDELLAVLTQHRDELLARTNPGQLPGIGAALPVSGIPTDASAIRT